MANPPSAGSAGLPLTVQGPEVSVLLAGLVGLLIIATIVALAARRLKLPYTVGLVVTGIALALGRVDLGPRLTHDVIYLLILPPLLFEAALSIHWQELKRDMAPVMLLSILGVVVSAAVVAFGMAGLLGWPLKSALVFGVLIAATDPVAVIAMFKDLALKGRLRLLVESESLFNDGVAAVLFAMALAWATASEGTAPSALASLQSLLTISGGGVAAGLLVGAGALLIAGRTRDHLVSGAVTAVAAYGSFLIAEYFHFSGVLATVSAGLLIGNANLLGRPFREALSGDERAFVVDLWEFAAFIANSFIFLLIGLTVAGVPFARLGVQSLAAAIILVLLGRALTVYPLSALLQASRWRIALRDQHVLWWGGLRGALALALALSLPASLAYANEIRVAAFAVVVFSVVVQGLTMPYLLRRLGRAS
jgi:CPA1 family monovalent cation:H+ antiporter